MSSKKLILIASLLALCLCSSQKKSCIRPIAFTNVGEIDSYVKCIKSNTGPVPYGKRSVSYNSPFFQKLHPMMAEYDPEYLEFLYQILTAERDMQA